MNRESSTVLCAVRGGSRVAASKVAVGARGGTKRQCRISQVIQASHSPPALPEMGQAAVKSDLDSSGVGVLRKSV